MRTTRASNKKVNDISACLFDWLVQIECEGNSEYPLAFTEWSKKDWEIAKRVAVIHGFDCVLGKRFENNGGSNSVPDSFVEFVRGQYLRNKERISVYENIYKALSQDLGENHIEHFFFKGFSIINKYYEDRYVRPIADLDIYIGDKAPWLEQILIRQGFKLYRQDSNGATYYDLNSGDKTVLGFDMDSLYEENKLDIPLSIDVHFTMKKETHFSRFDLTRLFNQALKSGEKGLSGESEFLYLLVHCAKHLISRSGRWIQLYDLYRVWKNTNLDQNLLYKLAIENNVQHLVYLPLAILNSMFPVSLADLEKLLKAKVSTRIVRYANRTSLQKQSICNPYRMDLPQQLFFTLSSRDFFVSVKKWVRTNKDEYFITLDGSGKTRPLIVRVFSVVTSIFKKRQSPYWGVFETLGLDPKRDWI